MNINRIVDSYPTKWPEGLTNKEQKELCKKLGIDYGIQNNIRVGLKLKL